MCLSYSAYWRALVRLLTAKFVRNLPPFSITCANVRAFVSCLCTCLQKGTPIVLWWELIVLQRFGGCVCLYCYIDTYTYVTLLSCMLTLSWPSLCMHESTCMQVPYHKGTLISAV